MAKTVIGQVNPDAAFSPGIQKGSMLFVAGQIGMGSDGKLAAGGIGPETRQTLNNIVSVLTAGGASLKDVCMVNVYLTNFGRDLAAMNAVYKEFFAEDRPARATVEVTDLARGALIEITAIAVLD